MMRKTKEEVTKEENIIEKEEAISIEEDCDGFSDEEE